MKKIKRFEWFVLIYIIILISILLSIFICLTNLVNAQTYPTIKPFVNDFANVMTKDEAQLLDIHCTNIKINTGYEIAIVSINTTNGDEPLNYANHIGEQNGVGTKETDNGIVVLWVVDENKGAIAVGRGAESYLNDAKVGEIGRASRNLFDNKLYYKGYEQIVSDIEKTIIERDKNVNATATNNKSSGKDGLLGTFILILIIGLIIYLILSKAGVIPRRSFGFGGISFGGGGGGRSFGGGSFGGGGSRF